VNEIKDRTVAHAAGPKDENLHMLTESGKQ
jgi:hypothetical protein